MKARTIIKRIINRHNNMEIIENLESLRINQHNSTISQTAVFTAYQYLIKQNYVPDWKNIGFREYSQTDEDGILLFIFSIIGFTNKMLVDIACGSPIGSNSANLLCNLGFYGLLIDGEKTAVEATREFYRKHPVTHIFPPVVKCEFVTAENINQILSDNNITNEIDLLLLDVDGMDYWFWKKIEIIKPRVVVLEACTYLGRDKSITVPYNPRFNRFDIHPDYMGASIMAYQKLSLSKGYRMVACNQFGFNLFFVREDIAGDFLPEISVDDCFFYEPVELKKKRMERLNAIKGFDWIEV